MKTLTDLTTKQLAAAFGVINETNVSPKMFNTKARAIARLEALLTEKGMTVADARRAAGFADEAEPQAETETEVEAAASEPAPVTEEPVTEAEPATAETKLVEEAPVAEPAAPAPLDASEILTGNQVINDTRDLLVRYLIDSAKLDPETAVLAALRAVAALKLPEAEKPPATTPRQPRAGTKQETVLALLRRPEGATIAEIAEATGGWMQHTVRGFLAGLKKKGITVNSQKPAGATERSYHLPA